MILKNEMPHTLLSIWGQNLLEDGWTTIPNSLLRYQSKLDISNSELVVLIHLISFIHHPNAQVYPSINLLSERTNQDRRTIQRTIRRLEEKDLVRKRVRSKGKTDIGMTNTYDIDPLMRKLIGLYLSKPANPAAFPHICPKCKKTTANDASELQSLFGHRITKTGMKPQSYCLECRYKTTNSNDRELVNLSEEYELNYHLKKVHKLQNTANRETLRAMAFELKTREKKNYLTHVEFNEYIHNQLHRLS